MRTASLLFLFLLSTIRLSADPPDWNINPGAFSQSVSITGNLYINDVLDGSANNIIGVFVDDELRGYAQAQVFGSVAYYFITVYSNTPSTDLLTFRVYVQSEDAVFNIEESMAFNAVSSGTTYEFNTYMDIDQPISLSTIPGQTQVQGFPIDSIYLPDYLIQIDDDPISWKYNSDPELTLSKLGDWLYIRPTNSSWFGTATYTVTATEITLNGYSASQTVSITILQDYGPPVWDMLSGQKIGKNQTFRHFDLDDSVLPYGGSSLAFNYFMPQTMGTDPDENWSFSAKSFQYDMSVTARVRYGSTDHSSTADRLLAYIDGQLVGVTSPKIISGIPLYFLTVYSDRLNVEVELKLYDAEYDQLYTLPNTLNFQNGAENGRPDNPLNLNTSPLEAIIANDGAVVINRLLPAWVGTQSIAFIAYDTFQPLVNADTIFADFTVADENAPLVSGIPDQYVEQGTPFPLFDLDNYLTELDGDKVNWSTSGASNLNMTIASNNEVRAIPFNPGWTGSEVITFRVTDETTCALYEEQRVTYTIGAPNQAPEFLSIPEQVIGIGDTFPDLDLSTYLNEPNGDGVSWSYFFEDQQLNETAPTWNINPGSFQYSMTMTVQVAVRTAYPAAAGHQLAAFHQGQLRGVANAQAVNGDWMFFLNVYSNTANDSIHFKYYDPSQEAIYAIDDSVRFVSQQQLGTAGMPFELFAGFVDPAATAAVLQPKIVDKDWLGADTLYAIATELGTFERYKDTAMIVFRVLAESPVLPVDLINFFGRKQEEKSILEWQIANPDQLLAFEIQRSTSINGTSTTWESLGQVLHESDQSWYTFTDEMPETGENYYRLKMIDMDGSFMLSKVVNVTFDASSQFRIRTYPNPAHQWVAVDLFSLTEQEIVLELYDKLGRLHMKLESTPNIGRNAMTLALDTFPAGSYYLKVSQGFRVQTIPLLIQSM